MAPFNPERLTIIVTFLHAACAMGFLRTAVTFEHGQEWVQDFMLLDDGLFGRKLNSDAG